MFHSRMEQTRQDRRRMFKKDFTQNKWKETEEGLNKTFQEKERRGTYAQGFQDRDGKG